MPDSVALAITPTGAIGRSYGVLFWPMSNHLFPFNVAGFGRQDVQAFGVLRQPPTASLHRERMIYTG